MNRTVSSEFLDPSGMERIAMTGFVLDDGSRTHLGAGPLVMAALARVGKTGSCLRMHGQPTSDKTRLASEAGLRAIE